jgi:protein-disulfide isomerase
MVNNKSRATRRAEAAAASERAAAIRRDQERRERRRRTIGVTAAVLVVLALILGIGYALQSSRDTTGASGATPQGVVGTYAVPVGQASAPVKVEIYEDFMCPICGEFEAASGPWLAQYADQGKVYVNYHVISILDRFSNGTEYSTRSANAAAAVLDVSGPAAFKKFHDLLYRHQPQEGSDGLSDQQLIDYAVQAGAPRDKVTTPIKQRAFEQWVKNATDAASKRPGFQGTPAVYVDGTQLTGYQTMDQLNQMLRQRIDAKNR